MASSNNAIPVVIGAVVLVAVLYVGSNLSTDEEVTGTVAPAERYRADQPGADDIQLGDQSIQELMQTDAFDAMNKDESFRELARSEAFAELAGSAAFGDQTDEFANFFFGGFGNNYVDRL